jgi:hypothetical protein
MVRPTNPHVRLLRPGHKFQHHVARSILWCNAEVPEVCFEDRFQYDLGSGLDNPVTNGRDSERALASIRIRNIHPPNGLWTTVAGSHFILQLTQVTYDLLPFNFFNQQSIHPGTAAVGFDLFLDSTIHRSGKSCRTKQETVDFDSAWPQDTA